MDIIPEQFTVKAHSTLFEGKRWAKNEALLFQSTDDIHFQNTHKTHKKLRRLAPVRLFLFRSCNIKKRSGVVLFFKIVVSRQQKDCKYQMLVKCIRSLIWAGLNSDVWKVFILQGSSRSARVPINETRSNNLYEFNIAPTLHQPAIVVLITDYIIWFDLIDGKSTYIRLG